MSQKGSELSGFCIGGFQWRTHGCQLFYFFSVGRILPLGQGKILAVEVMMEIFTLTQIASHKYREGGEKRETASIACGGSIAYGGCLLAPLEILQASPL